MLGGGRVRQRWPRHDGGVASMASEHGERVLCFGVRGAWRVFSVQGLGGSRGVRMSVLCLCALRPEMALAYVLMVWSAMAEVARSSGEQGKEPRLTVGVVEEGMAVQ